MSYYEDEEDRRASAKFYGLLFKIIFNIAVVMILYKLLYIPNYTEELRNSPARFVMPIMGTIGTYFYLAYWFGRKNSLYIVGVAGFSIGLMALTSFEIVLSLYGLGTLGALIYGGYLLVKALVQAFIKRR